MAWLRQQHSKHQQQHRQQQQQQLQDTGGAVAAPADLNSNPPARRHPWSDTDDTASQQAAGLCSPFWQTVKDLAVAAQKRRVQSGGLISGAALSRAATAAVPGAAGGIPSKEERSPGSGGSKGLGGSEVMAVGAARGDQGGGGCGGGAGAEEGLRERLAEAVEALVRGGTLSATCFEAGCSFRCVVGGGGFRCVSGVLQIFWCSDAARAVVPPCIGKKECSTLPCRSTAACGVVLMIWTSIGFTSKEERCVIPPCSLRSGDALDWSGLGAASAVALLQDDAQQSGAAGLPPRCLAAVAEAGGEALLVCVGRPVVAEVRLIFKAACWI